MKTLNVSVCCYHRKGEPETEKQGVLLQNDDEAKLVDVTTLATVDIADCVIREMPNQGCFGLPHSFSPELRKAVKDSRRLTRIDPEELRHISTREVDDNEEKVLHMPHRPANR